MVRQGGSEQNVYIISELQKKIETQKKQPI